MSLVLLPRRVVRAGLRPALVAVGNGRSMCKEPTSEKSAEPVVIVRRRNVSQTAVVTGASRGIGLECVKALLQNNATNVALSDVDVKQGEAEVSNLRREYENANIVFLRCDVTKQADVEELFKTSREMFGPIDTVVNNAGILNEIQWDRMVEVNLRGVIMCTYTAMPFMVKQGGTIVNVSSVFGVQPIAGSPVECATKHGVIGLTRSLAMPFHYVKNNIRVMALCPGVTRTGLVCDLYNRGKGALANETLRALKTLPVQEASDVGRGLIKMLKSGETGSCWICEDGKCYKIFLPDRRTLRSRN